MILIIVEIYQAGTQMVGFVSKFPEDSREKSESMWSKGQLKMSFDVKSSKGFYLMGDKTPFTSGIKLNKFSHLEVSLFGGESKFSFAKVSDAQK